MTVARLQWFGWITLPRLARLAVPSVSKIAGAVVRVVVVVSQLVAQDVAKDVVSVRWLA